MRAVFYKYSHPHNISNDIFWYISSYHQHILSQYFPNFLLADTFRFRKLTILLLTTYICRTAQLTSRRCILNIYSTDIITEYFEHAAHYPFFFSSRCHLFHNAIFFGSFNIHILNTGYSKILKKITAPKG